MASRFPNDGEKRRLRSTSLGAPIPTRPVSQSTARDLGPGTIVGYVYPSELTIEIVVLESNSPRCRTAVGVYEYNDAVVIGATAREASDFSGEFHGCDATMVASTQTRRLTRPLGDRPILTAAPFADPAAYHLAYGPEIRPEPLAENPPPGVVRQLDDATIDPAWVAVPLLNSVSAR